jgi:hypothetical protein
VFGVGVSAASPPIAAVAALASDNDNPAAPNIGTAFLLRFRFEAGLACDMESSLRYLLAMFDQSIE